ncbi:hypothetical protein HK104_004283, partial [Borealophlyctis nickersoniae]
MAPTDQTQTNPSPAIPCELFRLVAQRSTPTCAASLRQLNRLVGWLITIEDLAKVQASCYWKRLGSAAVKGIKFEVIPPEVTEKIYTALVSLGADPLPHEVTEQDLVDLGANQADPLYQDAGILKWSLVEGHLNVTRAIAAAGVDILGTFDFFVYEDGGADLDWYPDFCSLVYLVKECGLQNLDFLLSGGIIRGQPKCVQFLLTSGADMRSLDGWVVYLAAERGQFETLELLLDMGLEGFRMATAALAAALRSNDKSDKDTLPTVKVLIRGGANISAAALDMKVFLSERRDIVDFLFSAEELVSEWGKDYALVQGVWKGDETGVRGADVNAFDGMALCLAVVKGKEEIVKLLRIVGQTPM